MSKSLKKYKISGIVRVCYLVLDIIFLIFTPVELLIQPKRVHSKI